MIDLTINPASPADLAQLLPFYRGAAARPDCPWDEWYPDPATLTADQSRGQLFCARTAEGSLVGAYVLSFDDPETTHCPAGTGIGNPPGKWCGCWWSRPGKTRGWAAVCWPTPWNVWPGWGAEAAASWWGGKTTAPSAPMPNWALDGQAGHGFTIQTLTALNKSCFKGEAH